MSMVPPSLLCLGLCLSQSTWAQKGNLPPPRITALPGSTVPAKSPVTLLCQGPKQAEGYRISRLGSPEPMDKEEQITSRKTNALNIAEVTTDKTGLYHCSYQRGGRWSQFSDPLQLVMTGEGDPEAAELGLTSAEGRTRLRDRKQEDQALSLGGLMDDAERLPQGEVKRERDQSHICSQGQKGQCLRDPSLHR
uniref:Ig-like domain-containing protein n=1 Tax=Bos mutus grunniens TaxID=30521 RepID=A0A8C0ADG4_BOSMU